MCNDFDVCSMYIGAGRLLTDARKSWVITPAESQCLQ